MFYIACPALYFLEDILTHRRGWICRWRKGLTDGHIPQARRASRILRGKPLAAPTSAAVADQGVVLNPQRHQLTA